MIRIRDSISSISSIRPKWLGILQEHYRIGTVEDLLLYAPLRYQDKTKVYTLREIHPGMGEVQCIGVVVSVREIRQKKGKRLEITVRDAHAEVKLVWFRFSSAFAKRLVEGKMLLIFGEVKVFAGKKQITHPVIKEWSSSDPLPSSQRLSPVYHTSDQLMNMGLTQHIWGGIVEELLKETREEWFENIPQPILSELGFISRWEAISSLHFPTHPDKAKEAEQRLAFEELLMHQIGFMQRKSHEYRNSKGVQVSALGERFHTFYADHLPFELTLAQKRVLKEIRSDLGSGHQMNRLLQGDVGSGKTIVAALTALMVIDAEQQVALIAPTEILAQQHFESFKALLQPLNISVVLLTGSVKKRDRVPILEDLKNGKTHLVIGTHALLEPTVVFKNLGLAIIDEQHRFGVKQRGQLWKKNPLVHPHILLMSATPIPRTLNMALSAELDVSVIDELPPGRKPVETFHGTPSQRNHVIARMKTEIAEGRQVYIVYPLIEESETLDLQSIQEGFEAVSRDFPRPHYSVAILHGKMKADVKQSVMEEFADGKHDILVSTTVIEVGVNVPNASVMVIENANRFGLSVLHQLRGRVGRGSENSFCYLMTDYALGKEAKQRIETLVRTQDGFEIAETDLQMRGAGQLMGTAQSGDIGFKVAKLSKHREELEIARKWALNILNKYPDLMHPELDQTRRYITTYFKTSMLWSKIS